MSGDLTKNFSTAEFLCKCGCGADRVSKPFLWKLQYARDLADIRFTITSGCRCEQHNKAEGGSEGSDHLSTDTLVCEGADIKCSNSYERYKIVTAGIQAGFRRIGIAKTFVHLGDAERNHQKVLWVY